MPHAKLDNAAAANRGVCFTLDVQLGTAIDDELFREADDPGFWHFSTVTENVVAKVLAVKHQPISRR